MSNTTKPPGPQHATFTAWAKAQGISINGCKPVQIPGRGLGIVASRKIEAGEELVKAPASALLTVNSVPDAFNSSHEGITVQGLLASFLSFGDNATSHLEPWKNSWPSMEEFQSSMPILWPKVLRGPLGRSGNFNDSFGVDGDPSFLLPPGVGGRWANGGMQEWWGVRETSPLYRQEKKLQSDWEVVARIFPDRSFEEYTYYWLIVNTRSFYFDALGGDVPESHDDRMVLCPFVDYFNHSDKGCEVTFDESGYTVTSDRAYEVGEEVYVSYGTHSNDFLLVEYGFILDRNKWDALPLDDFFCGCRLNGNTRNRLKNAGYFGDYTLNKDGVCHRTQVAVRTETLRRDQWRQFVQFGEIDDEDDERYANKYICVNVLMVYYKEAELALDHLRAIKDDKIDPLIKQTLIKRWEQIIDMSRSAFQNSLDRWVRVQYYELFDVPEPEGYNGGIIQIPQIYT